MIQLYKYHYSIKNVVMTLDANYNFRNGCITYLQMENDYMNRFHPIISIRMEMPSKMIQKFYEYQETAMIKFDIYEYQYDMKNRIVGTSLWFQHSFRAIPAKDKTNFITSQDTITQSNTDPMKNLQEVELYLVDMEVIKRFTQKNTAIYSNVSKAAVLHALFQMRNFPSQNIIATPPAQDYIMRSCVLSFGALSDNIKELNKRYGLYSSDPLLFYDFDKVYLIDRFKPDITLQRAKDFGNITFLYQNLNIPDRDLTGSCNDPNTKTHYINFDQQPSISDLRPESSSQQFGTVTTVNKDGSVSKETFDPNSTSSIYVYNENEQTSSQYINETKYNRCVSLSVNDTALSFIKPFKTITFQCGSMFTDLGLDSSDTYRLMRWTTEIYRQGVGVDTSYIHSTSFQLQQIG